MIFIVVKFTVRPEHSEDWLNRTKEFTESTRAEPGNLFFEWSRSVDTPNQFILLEAFASPEAGGHHVQTEHFHTAMAWMPEVLAVTPDIINVPVDGSSWGKMAELSVPEA
jgi:quinol monooxygenase YgiN